MVETCAAFGVAAGRRDGHPGCWCDPDGADAAQDRRPRAPGRARRQLPRDRAQRDRRPRRLRPDRPVRDARRRPRPRSPPSAATTHGAAPTTGVAWSARRRSSPRAFAAALGAPLDRRSDAMAAGLFELRKDPITGWWVATVVDRAFHRDRSRARPSRSTTAFDCAELLDARRATASASGCSRTSRSTSSGTERGRPRARPRPRPGRARARRARPAAGGRSSRRPASTGRSTPSATRSSRRSSASARDAHRARPGRLGQTDYLQVVQNWGAQAGARTNHLCLDLYDLPQIPHRIAEELGGAARFVIREGECPFCRLVRDEVAAPGPARLGGRRRASPSRRTPRARRSRSGSCRAATRPTSGGRRTPDVAATAEALRQVLARLAASLDGPPYNLVLHTRAAARAGRRDLPLALGDPPPAARDRRPRAGDRPAGQPGLARRTPSRSCSAAPERRVQDGTGLMAGRAVGGRHTRRVAPSLGRRARASRRDRAP